MSIVANSLEKKVLMAVQVQSAGHQLAGYDGISLCAIEAGIIQREFIQKLMNIQRAWGNLICLGFTGGFLHIPANWMEFGPEGPKKGSLHQRKARYTAACNTIGMCQSPPTLNEVKALKFPFSVLVNSTVAPVN